MADKEYIERGEVEKAKLEIVDRMQEFRDEWERYSESTIDYHYGKNEGMEIGQRIVKAVLTDVADTPAADVVEVKHGKWKIKTDNYDCEYMMCSICKSEFYNPDDDTIDTTPNFCPNCGAKMDRK